MEYSLKRRKATIIDLNVGDDKLQLNVTANIKNLPTIQSTIEEIQVILPKSNGKSKEDVYPIFIQKVNYLFGLIFTQEQLDLISEYFYGNQIDMMSSLISFLKDCYIPSMTEDIKKSTSEDIEYL